MPTDNEAEFLRILAASYGPGEVAESRDHAITRFCAEQADVLIADIRAYHNGYRAQAARNAYLSKFHRDRRDRPW